MNERSTTWIWTRNVQGRQRKKEVSFYNSFFNNIYVFPCNLILTKIVKLLKWEKVSNLSILYLALILTLLYQMGYKRSVFILFCKGVQCARFTVGDKE